MIDPTSATFTEVLEGDTLVIVGQLALTEAATLDPARLAASALPRATLIASVQRALLVQLWRQAYGDLGARLNQIRAYALAEGQLALLLMADEALALLRPDVPAPAPEEGAPAPARPDHSAASA